jgi:peptidoglycan/LPS O-acetylase OafA/YrhL
MSPAQLEYQPLLATAYAASLYATMLAVAFVLAKIHSVSKQITVSTGRYGSLDGFRGVLAVGVFACHSFTAYIYFTSGRWEWTSSAIFNHLGQTTVAVFFMITGFLFSLKSMAPKVDWRALYISRFARLFPLYAIVVCIVFFCVFFISRGVLYESCWKILREFVQWLTFVCFGRPNVNGFHRTWTLIAGVNWSLKYEVIFYALGVPLLHFVSRFFSSRTILFTVASLILSLLFVRSYFGEKDGDTLYAVHFLCGVFTAYVYRVPRFLQFIQSTLFKVFAGTAVLLLFFSENSYGSVSILVTLALFAAVVGGLSVWGLLNTRAALWLGDISYGIYLIHGMTLWLTLFILKSYLDLTEIGLFEYWLVMFCVGGVIVTLASVSYLNIEKPLMALAKKRAGASRPPSVDKIGPTNRT